MNTLSLSRDMNLPLLYIVLPLAAVLLVCTVRWTYNVYRMSPPQREVVWGGFNTNQRIGAFCLTYLVSSLGGLLSFYLHVVYTDDTNVFPVFLFGCVNISYIVFFWAVDSERVAVVRACLWCCLLMYVMLCVYTYLMFTANGAHVSNAALVGVTDFCNAVAIFHAGFMDICLWFVGWKALVQ